MGSEKLEVAFHTDGVGCARELGVVKLMSLVPWVGVAIGVVEEVGAALVGFLFYPAVTGLDVAERKEVLIVLVLAILDDLVGDVVTLFVEIPDGEC